MPLDRGSYLSPRWSQEIADCSMPMTFDQYSACSYRCLYCFAFFRKALGNAAASYLGEKVRAVSVPQVKRIFTEPESSEFGPYVVQRLAMQWGGMADPFDENERAYGVGLELLRFWSELAYPISFSTKSDWFVDDERYMELIRGHQHFNFKVSIIALDEAKCRVVEALCPSPQARLRTIEKLAEAGVGGVTLRLRPFILGLTDLDHVELIRQAAERGAEAVSTEFLCVETRAIKAAPRYRAIGQVCGYDLLAKYREHSHGAGYLRLNRETKRRYMDEMQEACTKHGLRFYVSDAHFKERCAGGSCCGLRPEWNYSRAQFTEALLHAKAHGSVRWSDIEAGLAYAADIRFSRAVGFNQNSSEIRAKFHHWSMKDYLHYLWNHVNGGKSPYRYFGGVLYPIGRDEQGDVIYEYRGE